MLGLARGRLYITKFLLSNLFGLLGFLPERVASIIKCKHNDYETNVRENNKAWSQTKHFTLHNYVIIYSVEPKKTS